MNISNKSIYFRYGFFVIVIVSSVLHYTILKDNGIYLFFSLAAFFLGIGYYKKSLPFLIFFTLIVVSGRFFQIPDKSQTILVFLLHFCNYFLIVILSVALMKNYERIKKDNLELTKALSNALDSRDTYTLYHSENVAAYSLEIARKMKLSASECDAIYVGGLLHDIGKIGIPEHILKKPGQLTADEFETIKKHPLIGLEMIQHVSIFKENGVLDIVLYHHERYDGKGYPKGLKGTEIPLAARIINIADTFDAMTTNRVYRGQVNVAEALHEIRLNKGKQFDPEIADIFLGLFDEKVINRMEQTSTG